MKRLLLFSHWLIAASQLLRAQPVFIDINPPSARCSAIAPLTICLEYQATENGVIPIVGQTIVSVRGPEDVTGTFRFGIVSPSDQAWAEMRRSGTEADPIPSIFGRLPAGVEIVPNAARIAALRGRFVAFLEIAFDGSPAPSPTIKIPIQLTVNPRTAGFRMMQETIPSFAIVGATRQEQQRFLLWTERISPGLPPYLLQVSADTSFDGGQAGVDMRWYLTGCAENPPPCDMDAILEPSGSPGEHWAVWAVYGGGFGDRSAVRYRVTPRTADAISVTPAAVSVSAQPDSTKIIRTDVTMSGGGFDGVPIQATRSESWLEVSPARSLWPLTLTVNINPEGLGAGIYTDTVRVRVDGGGPILASIPVTFQVVAPAYAPIVRDGGGWRTSFLLVNASPAPAVANLRFHSADGSPLALSLAGGGEPRSSVNTSIPASGVRVIETAGAASAALRQGWAEMNADATVSMRVVLRQTPPSNPAGSPRIPVEATLPMTSPLRDALLLPFDHETGAIDSISLANPDDQPVTVRANLLNEDGTAMIADTEFSLGARGAATFAIPVKWPAAARRRGLLSLNYAGARLFATGFREAGTAFTAFPAVGRGLLGAERGWASVVAGGPWQSTVYFTNGSGFSRTGSFRLWPDTTRGKDTGLNEELSRTVPANGVTVWEAAPRESSPGTAEWGWLESRYQKDVSGYVLWRRSFTGTETPAAWRETAHAGAAGFAGRVAVPFDNRSGRRTSVSIVNTANEPTEVQTFIWDLPGRSRRFGETFRLPARGQAIINTAAPEWELEGQQGTLEFASRQGFRLTAAGLRLADNNTAVYLLPYEK